MTMDRSYYAIGTYNIGQTPAEHLAQGGISIIELDEATGILKLVGRSGFISNPSYLCKRKNERELYAVSEMIDDDGSIQCLRIEDGWSLERIGLGYKGPGKAACHVSIHETLPLLYCASYGDGRFGIINMKDNTRTVIQCDGNGPNKDRQEHSHAHQIIPVDDSRILISDLGSDMIWQYEMVSGKLSRFWRAPAGTGPRHMAIDKQSGLIFLICELEPRIFMISREGYTMQEIEYPADMDGAAIKLHPSGKSLAASFRRNGHVLFLEINTESHNPRIHIATAIESGGRTPRDIAFSSSGEWLLMLNQDSDSVISQRICRDTGLPEEKERGTLHITTPVSIIEL